MNVDKNEDLTLVKKKVSSHYVSPDMLAIKMLFENFGEKVKGYEDMSDEEILLIKQFLILDQWPFLICMILKS